jgi:hypothetical protein
MNDSGFGRIVVTFAVMILALYVSLDIFASGANAFGKFYFYLLIGGFLIGLFAPRRGFIFLLFLTAYLDYFKRLMILDSKMSQMDLYYVLGIAPATMTGIFLSLIYQFATGSMRRRPYEMRVLLGVLVSGAAIGVMGIASKSGSFRAVGDIVNTAAYIPLLIVIPLLFRTPEELRYILRLSIVMFIPSVFYYIYQTHMGFTWWEYRYIASGYTIEVRQLYERVPRVFGTLNGAGVATTIYSLDFAILLFGGFWGVKDSQNTKKDSKFLLRFVLGMLFAYAAYRTFSRAGWVMGVVAIAGFYCFTSRILTRTIYFTLGAMLGLMIAFSGYLLKYKILNEWSEIIAGDLSAERLQATNLSTMNARLEGFHLLLTEPKMWTPLGVKLSGATMEQVIGNKEIHDAFSLMLLKVGYIPLIFGGILAFRSLRAMHRFVYRQPDGLIKRVAVVCLSCGVAICIGAVSNGAAFNNYPINFYIYFYFGIVIALMIHVAQEEKMRRLAEEEAERDMVRERVRPNLRQGPGGRRPQFVAKHQIR